MAALAFTLVALSAGVHSGATVGSSTYDIGDFTYDKQIDVAKGRTAEPVAPLSSAVELVGFGTPTDGASGHIYDISASLVAPRIPAGLVGAQRTAISNVDSIFRSSDFGAIRNAHATGVATEVRIGGTTVIYELGMPASGMTLFGEDAFALGPQAFVSEAELAQTLLHESHRLATALGA